MQIQTIGAVRTMTSREIAELTGKEHFHVMRDIRAMLSELQVDESTFGCSYKDGAGRLQPAFQLPKRECLILVSGYSVAMRARIIDRWQELEAGAAPVQLSHSYTDAVAGMEVVARMLRLEGSAALGLVRKATEITAPHLLPALPVYAIDAPAGSATASSERTLSLTALLAEHRVLMSTRTANLRLQQLGLIEKATRPSSSGTAKSFWSVTEKGLAFGKNISSPENPRETQPHWFANRGADLLRLMGVLE